MSQIFNRDLGNVFMDDLPVVELSQVEVTEQLASWRKAFEKNLIPEPNRDVAALRVLEITLIEDGIRRNDDSMVLEARQFLFDCNRMYKNGGAR